MLARQTGYMRMLARQTGYMLQVLSCASATCDGVSACEASVWSQCC